MYHLCTFVQLQELMHSAQELSGTIHHSLTLKKQSSDLLKMTFQAIAMNAAT